MTNKNEKKVYATTKASLTLNQLEQEHQDYQLKEKRENSEMNQKQ